MELPAAAKELQAPLELVRDVAERGRLPVVLFCAGGIATPADAALMMQLGAEGNFVGSGIFKSSDPAPPRPRDCRGDHPLRRRPTAWPPPRASWARRCRGSRSARSRATAGCFSSAAGERRARGPGWPDGAMTSPRVGILALQGGFEAHARALEELGARTRVVRVPEDLDGLDGLVIPGGESTTMTLGIEREELAEPLREFVRSGRPTLGTCAGLIMLDRDHLGLLDVSVRRNAFGRQIGSFEAELDFDGRAAARACSSAPRGSRNTVTRSRCSPRSTAIRSRYGRATSSPLRSTPS